MRNLKNINRKNKNYMYCMKLYSMQNIYADKQRKLN